MLALVGFGSKAGVVPFHVWLPKAHPEAPSPVSALMSGAMVALGVYGIILVGDDLLGGGPVWWWLVDAGPGWRLGTVRFAPRREQHRPQASARLLHDRQHRPGPSRSGRVGTLRCDPPPPVGLAWAWWRPSCSCSTMRRSRERSSCRQGPSRWRPGRRDLDQLGGLLRRMPQTGALFLVAAAAITALPPLNGFIGEWLLFQSLLHGAASGNTASDIAIPLAVAAMALTAGLTVVAFVKAVGIGFLGRPRSEAADDAVEVPATMRLAVGLLVAVCVVLGVVPTLVFPAVERAVRTALPGVGPSVAGSWRRPPAGRAPRRAGTRRVGRRHGGRRGRRARPSPRAGAPAHAAGGRGVGMWSPTPDGPHAVHGDVVRRAGPAGLRRRASSGPGPRRQPRRRIALLSSRRSRSTTRWTTPSSAGSTDRSSGPSAGGDRRHARLQPGSVHRYLAYGFGALVLVLAALAMIG